MKDLSKDSFTLISDFYWKEVFKPSFIGRLQTGIAKIFGVGDRKKKYSTTKFKLIIEPVKKPEPVEKKKESDNEEFVITDQTRLIEIAEHDPVKFRQIMYTMYGPGWESWVKFKIAASSESFADLVNKYLESHKPTPEDIERMKEIPPDDLKMMVKEWWDEFILGGDKHEHDSESTEGDSAGT